MPFREEERDFLLTNAARDRAEHLLKEMQRVAADAAVNAASRTDLTAEQQELGRQAMDQAILAAQRMLANLNQALALAERAARAGGWDQLDALASDESDDETDGPAGSDDLNHLDDDDDDFVVDDDDE